MWRFHELKNTFLNLYRACNLWIAIGGTFLFGVDMVTNHATRLYLNFMQRSIRKGVKDSVEHYLSDAGAINCAFEQDRIHDFGEKTPIWVCWLQGAEHMPWIVEKCYKNLLSKTDSDIAEVVLITMDNYSQYVTIEDAICEKLNNRKLSYTNFSDYLRVRLLATYGGFWIDSTVYVTRPINQQLLSRSFYSVKTDTDVYVRQYVSQSRWASWLMLASQNQVLFKFVASVMREYYLKCNGLIDYFFIDYIIEIAYDTIESVRMDIDQLELNNIYGLYLFNDMFDAEFNRAKFENVYRATQFFKFSYRTDKKRVTSDGRETNFGYFCRTYLEE